MQARFKLVEKTANKLFEENKDLFAPALRIETLIERQSIRVIEKDLGSSVSGAAMVEDKQQVILVNKSDPENRRRFTMAHELGHIILHRDHELNVDGPTDDPVFLRDSNSSTGEYWREVEANGFAASILMPEELVQVEFELLRKTVSDDDELNERLAKKFKVSKEAMAIRRSKLGF